MFLYEVHGSYIRCTCEVHVQFSLRTKTQANLRIGNVHVKSRGNNHVTIVRYARPDSKGGH
jgi:hypothetical protein